MPSRRFSAVPNPSSSIPGTSGYVSSTKNFRDGMKMAYSAAQMVKRTTNQVISHPLFQQNVVQPLSQVASIPMVKENIMDPLAKASNSQHAETVKKAWSRMENTIEEIVDPDSIFARLQSQEEKEMSEYQRCRSGSWSSDDSDALIKEKSDISKKKLQQPVRKHKEVERLRQEHLMGDEDTGSEESLSEVEDPKKSDVWFREDDMIKEDDWKVDPRDRFMGEKSSRKVRKPKYSVEYDESSGEDGDVSGADEDERESKRRDMTARNQIKTVPVSFELHEAFKTPL